MNESSSRTPNGLEGEWPVLSSRNEEEVAIVITSETTKLLFHLLRTAIFWKNSTEVKIWKLIGSQKCGQCPELHLKLWHEERADTCIIDLDGKVRTGGMWRREYDKVSVTEITYKGMDVTSMLVS